jgi:hypothetical protein
LFIQEGEIGFKRALPYVEYVGLLAADGLADELSAVTGAAHDLFDGNALAGKLDECVVGFCTPQVSFILQSLGAGEQLEVDRGAPMALRMERIDLRTASRKAALAFSIGCQRSATWIT